MFIVIVIHGAHEMRCKARVVSQIPYCQKLKCEAQVCFSSLFCKHVLTDRRGGDLGGRGDKKATA